MKSFLDFGKQLEEAKATYTIKDSEGNLKHAGTDKDTAYKTHKSLNAKESGHKLYKNGVSCLAEPVKEETELDDVIQSNNRGHGYHGQYDHHGADFADKKYSATHSMVKKAAGAAGHLRDVKKPNDMVKHYLDSGHHGRFLAGNESNHDYIKKDFGRFRNSTHGHYLIDKEKEMKEAVIVSEADVKGHFEKKSNYLGTMTHKKSGEEHRAYVHPADNKSIILFDKHNKLAGQGTAREVETSHNWSRSPSRNESVEELDELSKDTLSSYLKKSRVAALKHHLVADLRQQGADYSGAARYRAIANKHAAGYKQALTKLNIEEDVNETHVKPRTKKQMSTPEVKAKQYSMYSNATIHDLHSKGDFRATREFKSRGLHSEGTLQPNGTDKIIPDEGMHEDMCQVCGTIDCKEHFYKSPARAGYVKEEAEHTVHVDDGSKYDEEPHPKDAEHVMSGVKKHGGKFAGHSDKGAYFKFGSRTDAKNFVDHVKKSPHRSVSADLHESTAHKIISTKLANSERMKNVQIPTPAERRAQLEKQKKEKEMHESSDKKPYMVISQVSDNTGTRADGEKVEKSRVVTKLLATSPEHALQLSKAHHTKAGRKVHSASIKEDISVDEDVDMGQADRTLRSKEKSKNNYHVLDKMGNIVSSHNNQADAIRGSLKNNDHRVAKFDEAVDTVKKDASGKVIAWSHEGDWEKNSTKNKQGAGKAANLAGQALLKTKSMNKEEVELDEASIKLFMGMHQVWHKGKKIASYASKTDAQDHARSLKEEVELDEGVGIGDLVKLHKPINGHHYGHVNGFTMDKNAQQHPGGKISGAVSKLNITLKKTPLHTSRDEGHDVKVGHDEYKHLSNSDRQSEIQKHLNMKEEVNINESAWGNDKMASLTQAHDRHMEKALAANKAGDDTAVKTHQRKMQMIQGKMQKLKNNEEVELGEECEILFELSKDTLRSYLEKGISKGVQDTFAGKGDISKQRAAGLKKAMKKVYGEEVEVEESYEPHLHEVNHREFAQQGKMHPDMAKHMKVGKEIDFYHSETGDKITGVVKHNSGSAIHVRAGIPGGVGGGETYKVGNSLVHKFKVSDKLDEGRMAELSDDLANMSHADFHKTYGKPKHHFDPTNFKKPVQAGHGMDRAKALAQRGMQSVLAKEEVEELDELSKGTLGSYVKKASADRVSRTLDYGQGVYGRNSSKAAEKIINRGIKIDKAVDKLTKEDTMVTYKEFMASIEEGHIDDLRDKMAADREKRLNNNTTQKETKKVAIGERPSGIGWGIKQAGKQSGKDFDVYERITKKSVAEGHIDDLRDKMAADREKRLNKMDYSREKAAAKNPITKVKGHSYGAGDEDGEAEPVKAAEPAEKRGRGRPAGSKSGARA